MRPLVLACIIAPLVPLTASADGLRGTYFAGRVGCPSLPDAIKVARVDANVDFLTGGSGGAGGADWGVATAGVPASDFTARWSGTYWATSTGSHTFEVVHDDEVVLAVDGVIALSRTGARPVGTSLATVSLDAGTHVVELCYAHTTGSARLRLQHRDPGMTAFAAIPSWRLGSTMAFKPTATRLDFDTTAEGTYITNQLATSHGIRFTEVLGTSGFYYARPRVVGQGSAVTASPTRLLRNESRDALEGGELSSNTPLRMSFLNAQSHVALSTGVQQAIGGGNPPAVLRAYNTAGAIVAADRLAAAPTFVTGALSVLRGSTDIAVVAVDFGETLRDERIDGLAYEAFAAVPIGPDRTPPAVEFVTPTNGQNVTAAGSLPVSVRVRESQSAVSSVTLSIGASLFPLGLETLSDPSCLAPVCRRYGGSIPLANGAATLTARAIDSAGNPGTASASITFLGGTDVRVVDEMNNGVAGAEVYVNGLLRDRTSATGTLRIVPSLPAGTRLVARKLTHEHGTYRGNHAQGSTNHWNFRIYKTSVTISDNGTPLLDTITAPGAEQVLVVRPDNGLVGVHLTATMNWQARLQADSVSQRFRFMSDYLYNATDGQFVIERVDLFDEGADWGNVDVRIVASNSLRAQVNWPLGGFLGNNLFATSYIHLPYYESGATFAHEFGHYGLDLADEYADGNRDVRCTFRANDPTDTSRFKRDDSATSCMMWNQGAAGKLCSLHADNRHVTSVGLGGQSCWDHVFQRYQGLGGLSLKTPTTRGVIPDLTGVPGAPFTFPDGTVRTALEVPVSGWRPQVFTTLRPGDVCPDFVMTFAHTDGTPAVAAPVHVFTAAGGVIRQGLTDGEGKIRIIGAHAGDQVTLTALQESGLDSVIGVTLDAFLFREATIALPHCPLSAPPLPPFGPALVRP